MAQSNRLRDDVRRAILGEGEDLPIGIQSGGLPTNGGNKPLAEANIQSPKKSLSGREIGLMLAEALERFGAGFQGKEDPVAKRKDREKQRKLEQEKIDLLAAANRFRAKKSLLDKEKLIFQKIKYLGDFLGTSSANDATKTQFVEELIEFDPELEERFGGMKVGFEGKEFTVERHFEEGELVDPSGRPFPEGDYRAVGRESERGPFVGSKVSRIAPANKPELSPLEVLQQGRARATDPVAKEEFTKRINKLIEQKPERLQLSTLEKLQQGKGRATDKKAIEEFNKRITKLTETPTSDIGELSAALNAAVKARDVVIGTPDEAKVEKTIRAIIKKLEEELGGETGTNEPIDVEFQNLGEETPSQGPRTLEEFKRLRGIP